jgi:hypothetical protein
MGGLTRALAERYRGGVPWEQRVVTSASIAADPLLSPVYGAH